MVLTVWSSSLVNISASKPTQWAGFEEKFVSVCQTRKMNDWSLCARAWIIVLLTVVILPICNICSVILVMLMLVLLVCRCCGFVDCLVLLVARVNV